MKTTFLAILTALTVCSASAATVTFGFSTPANTNLGSYMHSFVSTPSGYTITAYGFEDCNSNNLYLKSDGATDTGLGLAGQSAFGIDDQGIVVLNISSLSSATALQLEVNSVDHGDNFAVYGLTSSDFNGTSAPVLKGNALVSGGSSLDGTFFSIPNYSSYKYLALTATSGNVLLEGVTANVPGITTNLVVAASTPEPATMTLAGLALAGLALVGRRKVNPSKS